jgi:5-formyltetrahydrofolate cyclo-ligase
MSLDIDKRAVRERIIALRDALPRRQREAAGVAVRRLFHAHVAPAAGSTVSAFWPSKGEIDVLPLLRDLHDRGHRCALPVVVARRTPLVFRRWTPETELVPGNFGIPVPPETAEIAEPELLLVPLLGFDRAGHRLGWGGGFYDRTLAKLRADRRVTAVGVAFAAQEVDRVPHGPDDQPLDWVITEREAIRIGDAR